ncbi:MAG TPA: hypothetical protein DCR93_34490, partial [Cytophagales bacterium]|nr:hypothetical protein [Cytophagales bacterium]
GQRQVAGARGLLPLADGSMIVHSDGPTYLFDPQKGRELYQDSVTQDPLFYLGGRSFLIDIQGDRWHSTR